MTLVEFLRARLDEDELKAVRAERSMPESAPTKYIPMATWTVGSSPPMLVVGSARVLAEVDAKRRIVEAHDDLHDCDGDPRSYVSPYRGCYTLRLLALPYDQHPDYDPSWRP